MNLMLLQWEKLWEFRSCWTLKFLLTACDGYNKISVIFATLGAYDSKRKSIWCFPLPKAVLYACYYQINIQYSITLSLVFSKVVKFYLLLIFILVRYLESEYETVIQLVLLFFFLTKHTFSKTTSVLWPWHLIQIFI